MRIKTIRQHKNPRRPIKSVYMVVLEQKGGSAISQFSILR
jgi:hypothetical protein